MHIEPTMPGLRIQRSYPQPDAPQLGTSPRNRALAVYKYLLDLEPGDAIKHPLFKCIEHAFKQEGDARMNEKHGVGAPLDSSFVKEISTIPPKG